MPQLGQRRKKVRITAFLGAKELLVAPPGAQAEAQWSPPRLLLQAPFPRRVPCSSFSLPRMGAARCIEPRSPALGSRSLAELQGASAAVDEFRCHQGFSLDLGTASSNTRTHGPALSKAQPFTQPLIYEGTRSWTGWVGAGSPGPARQPSFPVAGALGGSRRSPGAGLKEPHRRGLRGPGLPPSHLNPWNGARRVERVRVFIRN